MSKRTIYNINYKSKVALDAIKGDLTLSEIAAKYNVDSTQIIKWKKVALSRMHELFATKGAEVSKYNDRTVKDLHEKIGQLLVEKDFLLKAFEN